VELGQQRRRSRLRSGGVRWLPSIGPQPVCSGSENRRQSQFRPMPTTGSGRPRAGTVRRGCRRAFCRGRDVVRPLQLESVDAEPFEARTTRGRRRPTTGRHRSARPKPQRVETVRLPPATMPLPPRRRPPASGIRRRRPRPEPSSAGAASISHCSSMRTRSGRRTAREMPAPAREMTDVASDESGSTRFEGSSRIPMTGRESRIIRYKAAPRVPGPAAGCACLGSAFPASTTGPQRVRRRLMILALDGVTPDPCSSMHKSWILRVIGVRPRAEQMCLREIGRPPPRSARAGSACARIARERSKLPPARSRSGGPPRREPSDQPFIRACGPAGRASRAAGRPRPRRFDRAHHRKPVPGSGCRIIEAGRLRLKILDRRLGEPARLETEVLPLFCRK